jgi:hypothetical protein
MSDDVKVTAFVRVRVEVEVVVSPYGGEWTLAAIREQAHREAPIDVANLIATKAGSMRVVGITSSDVVIRTEPRR